MRRRHRRALALAPLLAAFVAADGMAAPEVGLRIAAVRPPTIVIGLRLGHQAVTFDGVRLTDPRGQVSRSGALQTLVGRYGRWESCAAYPDDSSKWIVGWAPPRELSLTTQNLQTLYPCDLRRALGRITAFSTTLSGTLVRTTSGSFRIGDRFGTLPRGLRRQLIRARGDGWPSYFIWGQDQCHPTRPKRGKYGRPILHVTITPDDRKVVQVNAEFGGVKGCTGG